MRNLMAGLHPPPPAPLLLALTASGADSFLPAAISSFRSAIFRLCRDLSFLRTRKDLDMQAYCHVESYCGVISHWWVVRNAIYSVFN